LQLLELDAVKSPGLVPDTGLVNTRFAFPMLNRFRNFVTCDPTVVRPKGNCVGMGTCKVAWASSPSPNRDTDCGAGSLSVTWMEPLKNPAAPGVKVRENVQDELGASVAVHVLVANAKVPVSACTWMLVRLCVVLLLVSVTVRGALVVPITVPGKFKNVGLRLAMIAVAVPLSGEIWAGLVVKFPETTSVAGPRGPAAPGCGAKMTEIWQVTPAGTTSKLGQFPPV